ncbi:MAG: hypothetical protein WCI43_09890, partial [Candidatus Firestonebacteria bacterium]
MYWLALIFVVDACLWILLAIVKPRVISVSSNSNTGWGFAAIPCVVLISKSIEDNLSALRHEFIHQKQMVRWTPILFYVLYVLSF